MKEIFINLQKDIKNCQNCDLCKSRKIAIEGDGINEADIMLIGEAPGAEEDIQGKPFVGRSGKLLMQMLSEIGISRDKNLYITNILKCRPPENRNPKASEIEGCKIFLEKQIEAHNPKIIILVGNFASKYFLGKKVGISKIHGSFIEQNGRILFPVYHPAAILRNPHRRTISQEDFEKLKQYIINDKIKNNGLE